jgi:hypothetical protein
VQGFQIYWDLAFSAWHCDKLIEIETAAWGPAGRDPGRCVCDVIWRFYYYYFPLEGTWIRGSDGDNSIRMWPWSGSDRWSHVTLPKWLRRLGWILDLRVGEGELNWIIPVQMQGEFNCCSKFRLEIFFDP